MNSIVCAAPPAADAGRGARRLAEVVMARIAAAPVGEAQLGKDLHPYLPANLQGGRGAEHIGRLVHVLVSTGHLERNADALRATASGEEMAAQFLGGRRAIVTWPQMREGSLVLAALGMAGVSQQRVKAAAKADGLKALIVEAHYGLKLKGKPSAARIRHALALVALERAFGNQLKTEIGDKSALSAKASRLLAGQLAARPKDFGTDARLVAALAAEAVGVRKSDLPHLRIGVMRRFLADAGVPASVTTETSSPSTAEAAVATAAPAPAPASTPGHAPIAGAADARPDLEGFARAAKIAAEAAAEGWPGNRRAYVSQAFARLAAAHPGWGISAIEFKAMLTEAHRRGLIVLANADLKDKRRLADVQESAISYKNTVWHFIRCEG
jgi:hypothetical protein